MASSANIFLDDGTTGTNVTAQDGVAGQETPVIEYSPDRGTLVKILNHVATGQAAGIPLLMKLKDSAGNDLPVNTTVYLAVKRAGQSAYHRISEEITSIGHYNRTTITEQQDADNIDASKVELKFPEASGKSGSPSSTKIRGIDDFAIIVESAAALDTDQSTIQLSTDGVKGPTQY